MVDEIPPFIYLTKVLSSAPKVSLKELILVLGLALLIIYQFKLTGLRTYIYSLRPSSI